EALYSSMPRNALEKVEVDHVLPLAQIGPLLTRLSREPASPEEIFPVPENLEKESMMAEIDMAAMNTENYDANPSVFSCPECGGVLWELHEDDLTRFRCRVGHAFSIDSMQAEQAEALENALWVALKVLEENTSFS